MPQAAAQATVLDVQADNAEGGGDDAAVPAWQRLLQRAQQQLQATAAKEVLSQALVVSAPPARPRLLLQLQHLGVAALVFVYESIHAHAALYGQSHLQQQNLVCAPGRADLLCVAVRSADTHAAPYTKSTTRP